MSIYKILVLAKVFCKLNEDKLNSQGYLNGEDIKQVE